MSKLFKLKSWVSIDEAADRLTGALSEPVTAADVIRLALDGQLKMSIWIAHAQAADRVVPTPVQQAKFKDVPALEGDSTVRLYGGPVMKDHQGNDHTVMVLEPDPVELAGVFDLTLWGGEYITVADLYSEACGGRAEPRLALDGCFVMHPTTHDVFRLLARGAKGVLYPIGTLSELATTLCIRTGELLRFEAELCDEPTENPATVSVKERATFQKLILGMAMKGYKYDPSKQKNQAITEIESDLHELGIGLSDETIRKYLTAAAQSQLDRQKRH